MPGSPPPQVGVDLEVLDSSLSSEPNPSRETPALDPAPVCALCHVLPRAGNFKGEGLVTGGVYVIA